MFSNMMLGAEIIFQLPVLLMLLLGTFLGLIFGAIPGLTATLALILLLPVTFGMEPAVGMAVLGALYIGGVSGGKIPAILLNMPGTPSSIATTFDGYPLCQQGYPGKALTYAIASSFTGGMISLIALILLAPSLAFITLRFQSYEYFLLGVFGLTVVSSTTGKSIIYGLISGTLGLMIATIGGDPLSGVTRFAFGTRALRGGVELLVAMIGLFVMTEVFAQCADVDKKYSFFSAKLDSMRLEIKILLSQAKNAIRSSLIGLGLGMLPGAGGTIASFIAYDQAKKASKTPEKFGTGILDGIVAAETSNNAVSGGAYIPTITLGIPGNTVTAVILAGLITHGISPGPSLFRNEVQLVYAIFMGLLVSNIFMFILQHTVMIRFFKWALRIPKTILLPLIMLMSIAGTYNIRYSINDLWVMVIFTVLGYLLLNTGFPLTPMILGLILGPIMERSLRTAMMASGGSVVPFFTRPFSLALVVLTVASLGLTLFFKRLERNRPELIPDAARDEEGNLLSDEG